MELIVGVAVGVAVGDVLIYFARHRARGSSALVVTAAILLTIFAGASVAIVIQAAATAVLIVTLSPSTQNLEIPRFVDAFLGGGVALLVTAVLLPLNPLRVINRAARPALDLLAAQLDATADGAAQPGPRRAPSRRWTGCGRTRRSWPRFAEAIEGAKETATLSPARWHRRSELTHYAEAADPIDRAMRNSGTLIRRSVTLIEDEEPVPEPMPDAIGHLAESVRLLQARVRRRRGAGEGPGAVAAGGQRGRPGVRRRGRLLRQRGDRPGPHHGERPAGRLRDRAGGGEPVDPHRLRRAGAPGR